MKQATLALLIKDNKILLAMKKRGFGVGKWNGAGGKQNEGETIEETAIRETKEEVGVKIIKMSEVGRMTYLFPNKPDWGQEVFVYKVLEWVGEPIETEEMAPKWFDFDQIPYDEMWSDDIHWLPLVLQNKKVKTEFVFDDEGKIERMKVEEVEE